ncbi:MAG: hypothetical protein P9F19_19970 [Candidatus Contendobacter sp.]|nr:hypothetical protein [Candidatus Contendobacter sp.]MDG4559646.1 hypothetical protein [Candidatus Contendobacter sp.]
MRAKEPCRYEGKHVLLVEGINDCHVIMALCGVCSVPENFGIYQCGNDIEALRRLNALILQSDGPEIIGIVVDADSPDVMGRWRQIKEKPELKAYPFPDEPTPEGVILAGQNGKPKLGVWLMPDNKNPGMLEDFLIDLVPQDGIDSAKNCIANAKSKQLTSFKETHLSKAVIHTYLAWQDEPGKPLGQAVTAQVLQPHTQTAKAFIDWLMRLFNP